MGADGTDPRLAALGLIPGSPSSPPAPPQPAVAAPPPAATAPARSVAESPAAAPRVRRSVPVARTETPILLSLDVVVGRFRKRLGVLELEREGLRLTTRTSELVPWEEIVSVDDTASDVRIRLAKRTLRVMGALEGVAEPELAGPLAAAIREAPGGSLRETTLRAFDRAAESSRRRFREVDDPMVAFMIATLLLVGGAVLLMLLPALVAIPFRETAPGTEDVFLVLPRISHLDPRVLVATLAGGALVAPVVVRLAYRDLAAWAAGLLRGWHATASPLLGFLMAASAVPVSRPLRFVGLFLLGVVLLLPTARERTRIDAAGIHERAALPLFDAERPWSSVASVDTLAVSRSESPEERRVVIRFTDGSSVSTVGHDLAGLSEYALAAFARDQQTAAR